MGTWGTGIFDDDTAGDVRDEWVQLLQDGLSPPEATAAIAEKYGADDPVVVLALASTQWTWGRLDEDLKKRALDVLHDGSALAGWNGDPARARKLEALEAKLESVPPAPRPIRVVAVPDDWQVGEILSWRVMDGRWALMRVVGRELGYGKRAAPTCELLDWYEVTRPSTSKIRALPLRGASAPGGHSASRGGAPPFFTLGVFRPGEYPARRLRRLPLKTGLPRSAPQGTIGVRWDDFDEFLASRFSMGWTAGTILALRAKAGELFILQVNRVRWTPFGNLEVPVRVLDWRKKAVPTAGELHRLKVRSSRKYPGSEMNVIALGRPRVPERVSVIGWREEAPSSSTSGGVALDWERLEDRLVRKSSDL